MITVIDEISREKGISRSSFISNVLRDKVRDEKERRLRDTYDRVFSDEQIRKEQLDTCEWFELSGDNEGQGW